MHRASKAKEQRRQGDDAGRAAQSERGNAFTAIFGQLRHAAAAVRASREPTTLDEFEAAHSAARAAWVEARERTGDALRAQHAAQHERLLARFTRAAEEAVRTDDAVAALRGEQMALLGARRFTDALEHLKRVKAAEAKAGTQHRLRTEDANEAAVASLKEQQTCERAALELFASEFESEMLYAYSRRLFELGAAPAVVWPQQEAPYEAPAGWRETAQWAGAPAYGEPALRASQSAWHPPPAWENVPPPQNADGYAPPESWGGHDAPAFWGGEAPASDWPGPESQPFAESAPPPPLPLAPIPAGWGGRPARHEEPAARPAQPAAEADVVSKLLAAVALAAERKLAPLPQASAPAAAVAAGPIPVAEAPRHAARAHAVAQEPATAAVMGQPWLQPVAQFASQPAAWPEPVPPQDLSDDSSDAGTYSDSGADDVRDAPSADVLERIADLGQRSGEAAASSGPAYVQVQPTGEASKAAPVAALAAAPPAAPAAAPPVAPVAVPAAAPVLALPAPQPALPPPLPLADAGPQSGLGALLAARRETETAARAAAAQRREFTTADFRQLFSYCRHGKYRQAKDLLRAGCPVDGRDQFGNTPLIIACQNGHARLVKALLRHSAVIDAANKSGNTGLHYAVSFGFSPLADFLISQGADDKVRNALGLTPYEGIK